MSDRATKAVCLSTLPQSFRSARRDLDPETEFKALPVTEWKLDRAKRRVEGWAARYGNVDNGGDRLLPGSGAKTIAERLPRGLIKFFWNHELPLGMPETLEEHETGLLAVGTVNEHHDFDKYLSLLEQGVASHLSIGWAPVKMQWAEEDDEQIRDVAEYKLYEWSPVYWPMNELAEISAVKSAHAIRGVDTAADALRSLQLAYSFERVGLMDGKHAGDMRSLLMEITDLSLHMQVALDANKMEPEPPGASTPGTEPPEVTKGADELLGALRSLNTTVGKLKRRI